MSRERCKWEKLGGLQVPRFLASDSPAAKLVVVGADPLIM